MAPRAKSTRITDKAIGVDALDDFIKDLRRLKREGGPDGLSLLKAANYRVAMDIKKHAMTKAQGVGRQSARAASSMRAGKAVKTATLSLNNTDRRPWIQGAEFGTTLKMRDNVGGRGAPNAGIGWLQFRTATGQVLEAQPKGKTGHFLFPTMRERSAEIKEMYVRELDAVCKFAFPFGRL